MTLTDLCKPVRWVRERVEMVASRRLLCRRATIAAVNALR